MLNNNQSQTQTIGYVFSSGLGTRLMPYTQEIPKPLLLKQQDKSFLEINIERLLNIGISHIYVNFSYGQEYFTHAIEKYGKQVTLIYEAKPIGQGKTICNILSTIKDKDFLYTVNGDTIAEYDNLNFLNYAKDNNIDYLISSDMNTDIAKNLIVDNDQKLLGCKLNNKQYLYTETDKEFSFLNNLGDYIFNIKSLLDIYEEASIQDFLGIFGENDLSEIMIKNHKIVVVKDINVKSYFSINTIEEYNNFINNTHDS